MSVLIVIVNYKTPKLTIACLESLAAEVMRVPGCRVVVVDSASPDSSGSAISAAIRDRAFYSWCSFVQLSENRGFAYANNAAIRLALGDRWPDPLAQSASPCSLAAPDLIWLLNPDTLVEPGALTELVSFMDRNPEAGIAGSRACNPDGTPRLTCFRFHSPLGEFEAAMQVGIISKLLSRFAVALPQKMQEHRCDWVSGASMIVRRQVFEKIGLLDDSYFLYFEETDFCYRAARAGCSCWYVPASTIIHLVGQSSGIRIGQPQPRRPKYWFHSRRRYFERNCGKVAAHMANLLWLTAYPVGRAWACARGRQSLVPPMLWWDFLRYNYSPRERFQSPG